MLVRNFFDQFGTFDLNTLEWEETTRPVYGPASQEGEVRLDTLDEDDDSEVTIYKWVDHDTDGAPECRLSVVTRGRGPEYDASNNDPRNWPILDQLFGGRKAWETWLENWQAEFIQGFTASENVYAAYNGDVYASGYGYYMERVEELDEPGVREVVFASDSSRSADVMIYQDKNTGESHIMYTHPDTCKVTTSANPADHTTLDVIFGNREVWEGLCADHKRENSPHEMTAYTPSI